MKTQQKSQKINLKKSSQKSSRRYRNGKQKEYQRTKTRATGKVYKLQKESSEKLEENQQQSNKNLPRTGQHDIPQSLLKARIMEENKGQLPHMAAASRLEETMDILQHLWGDENRSKRIKNQIGFGLSSTTKSKMKTEPPLQNSQENYSIQSLYQIIKYKDSKNPTTRSQSYLP